MNIFKAKKFINYYKKKITIFLKIFVLLAIFILIFKEIYGQYHEITNTISNFNINFFLVGLIFYVQSQLIFAYIIYLIYKLLLKIKLYECNKIIFTSYFLDYFPFLGFAYKAKALKDKFKLSYKQYLSTYFILFSIGLLGVIIILSFLFVLSDENILNLNIYVKYLATFVFIFILFLNLFSKFFLKFFKQKKYFFYLLKRKINIFVIFSVFFQLLNESFIKKLRYFKFILLQILGLLILSTSFIFLFKVYQIEISLLNIILIFMLIVFSTIIKILPKNYGFEELAGSYLIEAITGSFAIGIVVMITYRLLQIIGCMLLFILFNININFIKKSHN